MGKIRECWERENDVMIQTKGKSTDDTQTHNGRKRTGDKNTVQVR